MSRDGPAVPECLPATLIEQLDALAVPGLGAARSYIDQRIGYCRTPIREAILTDTTGDVLGIKDHGAYALVYRRPPRTDGSDNESQLVSLYHVTQEKRPDGEETLHWSFVGDLRNPTVVECTHCGKPVNERIEVCPHCGGGLSEADY